MRTRTTLSMLLALALVAGLVTAPAATADAEPDDPGVVLDDGEGGDSNPEGEAEPDEGAEGPDVGDDLGIFETGDETGDETDASTDWALPLEPPHRPARGFDFPEPLALYSAESFPQAESDAAALQDRRLSVAKVVVADLDGSFGDDLVSLVYVDPPQGQADQAGFRSPGRAFVAGTAVQDPSLDPALGGWYVVVHLSVGTSLGEPVAYPLGTDSSAFVASIVVGDVNGDEHQDIVYSNHGDLQVNTLLNDGEGHFSRPIESQTLVAVGESDSESVHFDRSIVLGDVDGDDALDLVGISSQDDAVVIMRGNNEGIFHVGEKLDYTEPGNVTLIDAANDGSVDILVTSLDTGISAAIFHRTGEPGEIGAWTSNTNAFGDAKAMAAWVGDFGGDSAQDVALLIPTPTGGTTADVVRPFINKGSGDFTAVEGQDIAVPGTRPAGYGYSWMTYPQIDGTTVHLDSDSFPDILVPGGDGSVTAVFGDGAGGFEEPVTVAAAAGWEPVGDDGWDDTPEDFGDSWHVDHGTSFYTSAVAAVDVDGDDVADLLSGTAPALGVPSLAQLAWTKGLGGRAFLSATASSVLDSPWLPGVRDARTVLADWDGDRRPDIVIAVPAEEPETARLMMSRGVDGGVAPAVSVGAIPEACVAYRYSRIAVADIDGDGNSDLVCGDHSNLAVAWGNSAGELSETQPLGAHSVSDTEGTHALGLTDLDGDGDLDVVYATQAVISSSLDRIWLGWAENLGGGSFATPALLHESGYGPSNRWSDSSFLLLRPVIADLTGDGLADFAIAAQDTDGGAGGAQVFVYVNDGVCAGADGDCDTAPTFTAKDPVGATLQSGVHMGALEALDVDDDGHLDLIVSGIVNRSHEPDSGVARVLINDGSGAFTPAQRFPEGAALPGRVLADLNGDGAPDLVSPTSFRGVELRRGLLDDGEPTGRFASPEVYPVPGHALSWVAVVDVNGDDAPDIIGAIQPADQSGVDVPPNQLAVLINGGDATSPGDGGEPCDPLDEGCDDGCDAAVEDCEEGGGVDPVTNLAVTELSWQSQVGAPSGVADDDLIGATPGEIRFTVTNQGTTAIPRGWADSVWLSTDAVWESGDTLLHAESRTTGLAAGASFDVPIPLLFAPPTAGTYYLIGRADTRGDVQADTDRDDNVKVFGPILFDPPQLKIPDNLSTDPGEATTVTGPGAVVRIPEIAADTSAVRLTVSGIDVGGFAVRAGKLPTATVADQRVAGSGSVTLLPGAGERYVLLDLAEGQSATLTATRLTFGIGSIAPKRVSVGGPVSFHLTGAGLANVTDVTAIASDGSEIPGTGVTKLPGDGGLVVTFDLTDQEAGTFGVRVDGGATTATLADAFTAVANRVGTVRTSVLIPPSVRTGAVGQIWITFANDGLTDAVSPILRVSTRGLLSPEAEDEPHAMDQVYVSPSVDWAPVGVIPAGASGRIVIRFLVDWEGSVGLPASALAGGSHYAVRIDEFGPDSLAPYDAATDFADKLSELPDGDRAAVALELADRLGNTGGSYLAAMHRLRATLLEPTADLELLSEKLFTNVAGAFGSGAVRGTLVDQSGRNVANRALRVVVPASGDDAEARTIETRTDETGVWFARGLIEASNASIVVDGYGPGPVLQSKNLSADAAVEVTLPTWSRLSGTVLGADGKAAANAIITVASQDGAAWVRAVADGEGVYGFDGIEPGEYRVTAVGADGAMTTSILTMVNAAAVQNLTLASTDPATDGGTVTGWLPAMSIADLPEEVSVPADVPVWVDDGESVRPVSVEDDGSFAVVGTPGTSATLWIFDAFLGVRSANVTFPSVGATAVAVWAAGDHTIAIPVTLTDDNELPMVYLQPAARGSWVPVAGADAGMLLVPTGRAGDPVTWIGGTNAGDTGTLMVSNVPAGAYRITVLGADGDDVAEMTLAASDVTVGFGSRPATATASGTAMSDGATLSGGFVELVSTTLTPARRYVTGTGSSAAEPPSTPGAWSIDVAADTYAVTYYDSTGARVGDTESKTYSEGVPLRGAGRAFASAPATVRPALGSSYLTLPLLTADGDYGLSSGSEAELRAVLEEKFEVGEAPSIDAMVQQALNMPYPDQPEDECTQLDYSWLAAAKLAAGKAEATRALIEAMISDTASTRRWMMGEAVLRGLMFLGEIANFFLGVLAVKQAVGKAAATAAAREEAKRLAAQGLKPATTGGKIILGWQPILENAQKISALGATIYNETKAAVYSTEPASASAVIGKVGEIGNLVLDLIKDVGILATSAAAGVARELIGPISAVNNMITQVREAGESYRSAIAQLDNMKAALDQLYVSYDFNLAGARQAWLDFQANRFPVIELDGEDCEGGGSGGDDEGDEEGPNDPDGPEGPEGSDDDADKPNGRERPKGPQAGPKAPIGPVGGREVSGTDPNEIVGPTGVGSDRWVQPGTALGYRIGFENIGRGTPEAEWPEGWTLDDAAPAAAVRITFPLPDSADIDTVQLGDFGFGTGDNEQVYTPEAGGTSYEKIETVVKNIPAPYGEGNTNLTLTARAWLDRPTRTMHWEITLVDPDTGLPHAYTEAGFLPPEPGGDEAGTGQGWATISFATGTDRTGPVRAKASIVFDTNDAIETNEWVNHLDGSAPTASVTAAASTVVGATVTVGLDDSGGSGPGLVDVYRSVDDGPWLPWLYRVTPGAKMLTGDAGQTVKLQARAVDRVGNVGPLGAIATTRLVVSTGGGGGSESGSGSGSSPGSDPATEGMPEGAVRIAGSNRYATAAAIAARFGTADTVIVANGEDHKQGFDALAANVLAGRVGAPIVLTQAGRLPAESLAAICSVLSGSTAATRTIYLLGGTDTVSAAVARQLTRPCAPALGNIRLVRIAGGDRYETAALLATSATDSAGLRAAGLPGAAPRTAILASGTVNADALAAGAISARFGLPVLLTSAGRLPQATADALQRLRIERVVVLGGPDRVSPVVKARLGQLGVSEVITIAGQNRFETSALLAAWARTPVARGGLGQTDHRVAFANGLTGFADALAVGPLLGKYGGMLLLAPPATLPESLRRFLAALPGKELSLLALGTPVTIADSVIAAGARAAA